MAILKKDLQSLQREIKALGRKIERLIKEFDKGKKPKVVKKPTTKPIKAKTPKRSPAQKAPAKKKTTQPTATDKVLKIIRGSKKGVDTTTLMKMTGFNQKKVTNILQRTYKQGKIKRVGKGIYIGA